MSIKIKTVYENDIRVFKAESNQIGTIFTSLNNFISSNYGVKGFTLQYLDEENDYVTISSSIDLQDGIEYAQVMNQMLKVYVKASSQDPISSNITSDKVEEKENVKEETTNVNKESTNVNNTETNTKDYHLSGLTNELINNEKFREEFISFLTTILVLLREDPSHDILSAFAQASSTHESISNHPQIAMFSTLLPAIAPQIQPFMLFINALDPSMVSLLVNQIVKSAQGDKTVILPPWLAVLSTQLHGFSSGTMCGGVGKPCSQQPQNQSNPNVFGFDLGYPQAHGCKDEHEDGHKHDHGHGHGHGHNLGHGHGHGHSWGHGHGHGRGHGWGHGHPFGHHSHESSGEGCRFKKVNGLSVEILNDSVTLGDRALVFPKQSVVKTWKVKNNGELDWPEGTSIVYFGKPFNPIVSGAKFPIQPLKVNEEGEISILIEAPQEFGHYGSKWRLETSNGENFGRFFARINVVEDLESNANNASSKNNEKDQKKMEKLLAKREKIKSKLEKLQKMLNENGMEVDTSSTDENDENLQNNNNNNNDNNNVNNNETVIESNEEAKDENPFNLPSNQSAPKEENPISSVVDNDFDMIEQQQQQQPVPYAKEIETLLGMGYGDEKLLGLLLQEHKGNLEAVVEALN